MTQAGASPVQDRRSRPLPPRATAPRAVPPGNGAWSWAADLGCLALGVALAVSTVRLFSGEGDVALLVVVATAAWALATSLRRSPVPAVAAELTYLVVGVVAVLVVVDPGSSWYGVPTPASVQALADVVRADFSGFAGDIAPLDAGTGHLVVMCALIWLLALFVSTATMRLRTPVQGAIPHVTAIVALGLVARDVGRLPAVGVLLLALAGYAITQAAWRNDALRWFPSRDRGIRDPLRNGAMVLGAAALLTALLAPLSPAGNDPVVDFRHGGLGGGPRTVVSPFVEVGSNLGARSDELLFTVSSPRAGYWRLTALDTYDPGDGIWVLSGSYEPVDGTLDEPRGRTAYEAEVAVRGLGGIWVPTPADPLLVRSDIALNWDDGTSTLISRDGDLSPRDQLSMSAAVPSATAAALAGAAPAGDVGPELRDATGTPIVLAEQAAALTAGLGAYDSALALQEWFRTFTYDETVDYTGVDDPLGAFLEQRRGFCQQFSTGFALAARSLGLPTRVVVGFTTGDAVEPADPSSTPGGAPSQGDPGTVGTTFAVRGRHAHAWPEVRFEGVGWVPFEPTPGRGDPSATDITGVPGAQAAPVEGATGLEDAAPAAPTTSPATTPPSGGAASVPEQPAEVDAGEMGAGADDPAGTPGVVWLAGVMGVLALAGVSWWAVGRRRAGRAADPADRDPVQQGWRTCHRLLTANGVTSPPSETPVELAERVDRGLGAPRLVELARLESARRWSTHGTARDATATVVAAEGEVAALAGRADLAEVLERHDAEQDGQASGSSSRLKRSRALEPALSR